jgi:two-component system sensor histidine kinase BarA
MNNRRSINRLPDAVSELTARNAALNQALRSAQRANDSTSTWLASVSHEIRTPLNAILGFADLLTQVSDDSLQRDCLDTIRSSAHSLLGLLNGFIEVAGDGVGRMHLEITSVDLNAILSDIHSLFAPGAYARGIEFHATLVDQQLTRVRTDPLRLRQILINLADNALKFTRTGHVLVSAQVVQVTDRWCRVRFAVHDTGTGISRKTKSDLFPAFPGVTMRGRSERAGAGLGLGIVNQIVQLMHGEIAVRSEPGRGSLFLVTLPLALDGPPIEPPIGAQLPALLVQDYPALVRHQRRFLEGAGLTLVDRPQGRSGIVLVELSAARLRAHKQSALCSAAKRGDWPHIAYCSSWDPAIVRRLEQADYAGVIVKTGCPRRFRSRLDTILYGNRAISQRLASGSLAPAASVSRGRLLVVDDHPVNLNLVRHYCAELSVGVDCETSPERALSLLRKRKYHLIFLDIHLPNIDGREIARQVRSGKGENRDTPIVALTGDTSQEQTALIEGGMHALLVKPVSRETFRAAVRRWLWRPQSRTMELRRVLQRQLAADRATFVSLAQSRNYLQLAMAAHKLHGASVYCGLPKLTLAVRHLEDAARTAEPATVRDALLETLTAIDQSLRLRQPA